MKFLRYLLSKHDAGGIRSSNAPKLQWALEPGSKNQPETLAVHDEWHRGDSRIGKELRFTGTIVQKTGALTIFGMVDGDVQQDKDGEGRIAVGPGASLRGSARTGQLHSHGLVDATVHASEVVIERTAITRGSIVYNQIQIKGGDNKVGLYHRHQPSTKTEEQS